MTSYFNFNKNLASCQSPRYKRWGLAGGLELEKILFLIFKKEGSRVEKEGNPDGTLCQGRSIAKGIKSEEGFRWCKTG